MEVTQEVKVTVLPGGLWLYLLELLGAFTVDMALALPYPSMSTVYAPKISLMLQNSLLAQLTEVIPKTPLLMSAYPAIKFHFRGVTMQTNSIGQSAGLIISRSSVQFRQKIQKTENSNLHGFELHRPSSKGTKLLLQVIQAIINKSGEFWRRSQGNWRPRYFFGRT